MKPLTTGLIVCSVAILFVLWNRRFIFGAKKVFSSQMKPARTSKINNKAVSTDSLSDEEDETAVLLKGVLSLNRAAHVLSRSTTLLEKLLKMDKKTACDSLLRDYELSSVMVLIKHEEHGEPEGFKRISEVKKEKETKKFEMKELSLSKSSSSESLDHHSTTDPLRIALYCKNLSRPPRIGRVVRTVESEQEHPADQYIIELLK